MFGRGIRLTALSSLASAAVYSTNGNQISGCTNVENKFRTPSAVASKCVHLQESSTVFLKSNQGLLPENYKPSETSDHVVHANSLLSSENCCKDNISVQTRDGNNSLDVVDAKQPAQSNEELRLVDLIPPNYVVPDFHGPSGPEIFQFFDDPRETGESNLNHEWTEDPHNVEDKETPDFKIMNSEVIRPNEQGRQQTQQEKLKAAISKARDLCWCKMYESGSPGMVVSIAVNGKVVWQHGFGYADLENRLLVGTGCIMRIASISKPLTMAVLAKLVEEGKVDLDASVSKYVPSWPEKIVEGEKVDITVRQLCSHISGVRHYQKKGETDSDENEFEMKEYYLKHKFKTTDESLALFKDDELFSKPGSEFLYSTHGFTVLAAVIEKVTGEPFDKYMKAQFAELGLNNTYLDEHGPIIYNRSKYYVRDKNHQLRNAPYVDCSYKWAGGGFLSNVQDLTRFGNAMLYSYQKKDKLKERMSQDRPQEPKPGSKTPEQQKKEVPKEEVDKESDTSRSDQDENSARKEEEIETLKIHSEQAKDAQLNSAAENTGYDSPDEVENPTHINNPDEGEAVTQANNPVTSDQKLTNVVYQAGPFSSVNKANNRDKYLPGYLKSETMAEMWKPVPNTQLGTGGNKRYYGLGWAVRPKERNFAFGKNLNFYVSHTGGAIGASSVLLIAPKAVTNEETVLPQGVVVSIMCNLQSVGLNKLAVDIAKAFEGISTEKPVRVQKVYQC